MRTASVGSVSEATMRTEDLIPAFLDVLESHEHPQAPAIREEVDTLNVVHDAYGLHYDDDSRETASYILYEDIWEAMQDIAPEGFYFGAHPGDGADYGFWHCEMLD